MSAVIWQWTKARGQSVCHHCRKVKQKYLISHDLAGRAQLTKLQWTVFPHPPYSPYLALSDFHQFGPKKNAICGMHYVDDEAVIDAAQHRLRHKPMEWYPAGIQVLTSRWRKAISLNGDYVEK